MAKTAPDPRPSASEKVLQHADGLALEPRRRARTPHSWEHWVLAAYLRAIGATWNEIAEAIGAGRRTLVHWAGSPRWAEAVAEAERRWLHATTAHARRVVLEAIRDAGDRELAWRVLERRVPELAARPAEVGVRVWVVGGVAAIPPPATGSPAVPPPAHGERGAGGAE